MDDAASLAPRPSDPLRRARDYVERRLREPLDLTDLAAVASLSPYHFVRAFSARLGVTPMAYVRARRLSAAAIRLAAARPPSLVELAFDVGFESQEGFTRAFKRAFGVSPGRYRRERLSLALTETPIMTDLDAHSSLAMSPEPVRKPGLRVAGVSGVFDEQTRSAIPALWPRLVRRLPLPGQTGDDASFGVCWAASGIDGCFHYMAAVPIAADAPAPEGLEVKEVPAQAYLVFRQQTDGSNLHLQMQAAAREIWGVRVPASGYKLANAPDLEAYPPGFEPDRPSHVEWWIPVET